MACWLYQMNAKSYTQERYRTEVWEGNIVTNWTGGKSTRRPKDVSPGDIIILFYVKASTDYPGIYGWGVVTFFDEESVNFRPASPSDYLKMNPLWDEEINAIVEHIQGKMAQTTLLKIDDKTMEQLRKKIAAHVFGVKP